MGKKEIEIIITSLVLAFVFVVFLCRAVSLLINKRRVDLPPVQAYVSSKNRAVRDMTAIPRPVRKSIRENASFTMEQKATGVATTGAEETKVVLQWKRDPFRRGIGLGAEYIAGLEKDKYRDIEHFRLNGIVFDEWDPNNIYALINDEIAKTGDYISGFLVTQIKKDCVILRKDDKDIILRMWDEGVE